MTTEAPFNFSGQVTLNGSGYGTLRLAVIGALTWKPDIVSVSATLATTEEAVCKIYKNVISAVNLIDTTYSGSSGDSTSRLPLLQDGDAIICEWSAGASGAVATAQISGIKNLSTAGFRAVG